MTNALYYSIDWVPIGVYVQRAHEYRYHSSFVLKVVGLEYLLNDNYFTICRGYYKFLDIVVWAYSFGTTEEVYHHQIDE
jgi:hypothetical protein